MIIPLYYCPHCDRFKKRKQAFTSNGYKYCKHCGYELKNAYDIIHDFVKSKTKASSKERHGKWIKKNNVNYSPFDGSPEYIYICSVCGREENKQEPYCNCGANMEGVKDANT